MIDTSTDLALVTEERAAKILAISAAALRRWRRVGGGPPWLRIGERLIRYDLAALRVWIEEQAGVRNVQ
jgi:predicted DNA-binding transcriptional regulator AlpA